MSTPDRLTLSERMELARVRTAAARQDRDPRVPPAVSSAAQGSYWQLSAKPGEEVFLMPGQLHFSGHASGMKTLLGSCVAVTLWHPMRKIGGMCHYLLPARAHGKNEALDGRYGEEALDTLLQHVRNSRADPREFQAHLYGGADTMPEGAPLKFNVGERNIEQGWGFIDKHGFQLQGVDVGEDVPRTVRLDLASGAVDMRRGTGHAPSVRLPPFSPPVDGAPKHKHRR
jgi:chemotaxis protein CheD